MKSVKLAFAIVALGLYSGMSNAITVTPDNLGDILSVGDGPINVFGREIEAYEESVTVTSSTNPFAVGSEDAQGDGDHNGNNVLDGDEATATEADWIAVTVTRSGLFSFISNFWISSNFPPEVGFLAFRLYEATPGVSTWDTDAGPFASSSGAPIELSLAAGDYLIQLYGDININGTLPTNVNYSLEISTIPVPAAVWLFGTAMLGLLGWRRKTAMAAAA